MSKQDILKALKKQAKKDGLPTVGIKIMKHDGDLVMAMFPSNEAFPPVWFKRFKESELQALLAE